MLEYQGYCRTMAIHFHFSLEKIPHLRMSTLSQILISINYVLQSYQKMLPILLYWNAPRQYWSRSYFDPQKVKYECCGSGVSFRALWLFVPLCELNVCMVKEDEQQSGRGGREKRFREWEKWKCVPVTQFLLNLTNVKAQIEKIKIVMFDSSFFFFLNKLIKVNFFLLAFKFVTKLNEIWNYWTCHCTAIGWAPVHLKY